MPCKMRDGVSLFYELHEGALPAVLLIHGWCCDMSYLAPQAEYFAAKGRAVLSVDLRGHGRSDKPDQPYPIEAFTSDVAWLLRELGLEATIVVGHSMGGIIAYDLAARHPDLVGAAVMLDAAVVLPERARAAIPDFLERLAGPDPAAVLADYAAPIFFLPSDDPARKARILAAMGAAPRPVMLGAYRGLSIYEASAAGQVAAPALYIAADEPSPRADIVRLRELVPQLQFGQTVGSGHFCQLEVPEQVNTMIDRFLHVTGAGSA